MTRTIELNWSTVIAVIVFHVLALVALFNFTWQNFAILALLWWISGSLGIGIGYHRLLTHRGFKAPKWLERFFALCGTLALQSGPISWVTTHRLHHAFTETDKDPHTVQKGLYWAHIGWIFQGTAQMQSEETKKRYAPDLVKNRFYRFLDRYYWLSSVVLGLILLIFGGWQMVLWGIFLRTVFVWHATWLVNSATHKWGKRRFQTDDSSTNNALVAMITFGEGWHNNHHAFPRSARHGFTKLEIDLNWLQIKLLEKIGLASNVYAYDLKRQR
ncbi:MAG: fatty acid desaturase [Pyrinomonadaceae bacterium]|nr:fatty acid desaturase [Pyrinomonadaceae bacterium]MCX7638821.1 fatty acid desaturase [Pyrinomonadaceae bacterium]